MKLYPVKTPYFIRAFFKKWIWKIKTSEKKVFLTFDDGPIPKVTPWVIQQLKKYNAKATFFCIGDNIKKHPEVFQQILEEGHQIGNHTFNHLNGWKTSKKKYLNNILQAQKHLNINDEKLFRPPYGKISLKQSKALKKHGYKIIMWDVLSGDFDQKICAAKCTQNVLKNTTNGSIIVFHDSLKAFDRLKTTLPIVLQNLQQNGYRFEKIE